MKLSLTGNNSDLRNSNTVFDADLRSLRDTLYLVDISCPLVRSPTSGSRGSYKLHLLFHIGGGKRRKTGEASASMRANCIARDEDLSNARCILSAENKPIVSHNLSD